MRLPVLPLALAFFAALDAPASAQGWLGVAVLPDPAGGGILVEQVLPGSPAAEAGLEEGDRIVRVSGEAVASYEDLKSRLGAFEPGAKVEIVVLRDGKERGIEVRLGANPEVARARPAERSEGKEARVAARRVEGKPWIGLEIEAEGDEPAVLAVRKGSPAERSGLRRGDRILRLGRKPAAEIEETIGSLAPGEEIEVVVRRGDDEETIVVVLAARPEEVAAEATAKAERPPRAEAGGPAKAVSWIEGFEAAVERARKESRPVLVDFFATWCGPCKQLDKQTFSDPAVVELSRKFVCVKVDIDRDPETARRHGVSSVPHVLFLDPKGERIEGFVGYRDADEVATTMRRVLGRGTKKGQAGGAADEKTSAAGRAVGRREPLVLEVEDEGQVRVIRGERPATVVTGRRLTLTPSGEVRGLPTFRARAVEVPSPSTAAKPANLDTLLEEVRALRREVSALREQVEVLRAGKETKASEPRRVIVREIESGDARVLGPIETERIEIKKTRRF